MVNFTINTLHSYPQPQTIFQNPNEPSEATFRSPSIKSRRSLCRYCLQITRNSSKSSASDAKEWLACLWVVMGGVRKSAEWNSQNWSDFWRGRGKLRQTVPAPTLSSWIRRATGVDKIDCQNRRATYWIKSSKRLSPIAKILKLDSKWIRKMTETLRYNQMSMNVRTPEILAIESHSQTVNLQDSLKMRILAPSIIQSQIWFPLKYFAHGFQKLNKSSFLGGKSWLPIFFMHLNFWRLNIPISIQIDSEVSFLKETRFGRRVAIQNRAAFLSFQRFKSLRNLPKVTRTNLGMIWVPANFITSLKNKSEFCQPQVPQEYLRPKLRAVEHRWQSL